MVIKRPYETSHPHANANPTHRDPSYTVGAELATRSREFENLEYGTRRSHEFPGV